ncbi:MAG: hypothetical protein LBE79_13060 [Tannerella sp.]|jgi:hypothetical protein|nr:hypothetical protein [Tannerella sp.]
MAKKKPNIDFMMEYVEDYISGRMERMFFDMDIHYHIINRWDKMELEDRDIADSFNYYICECGADVGDDLSDAKYKQLIKRQYKKLTTLIEEGFW